MNIEESFPKDTPIYMMPAWYSSLLFAANNKEIMARFEADTGCVYKKPMTPIDRMIDESTGLAESVARNFVEWHNKNIWGPMGS